MCAPQDLILSMSFEVPRVAESRRLHAYTMALTRLRRFGKFEWSRTKVEKSVSVCVCGCAVCAQCFN